MPTGYTDAVGKGEVTKFSDFALLCSRAFGAMVTLRDEPLSKPIPEKFEVSDYYLNRVVELTQRLDYLRNLTIAAADVLAEAEFKTNAEGYEKSMKENKEQIDNYNNLLLKVREWTPPTKDHKELKKFMEQQLVRSIKFDDMSEYYSREENKPKCLDGFDWLQKELEKTEKLLKSATTSLEEEKERVRSRNEWLTKLRNSLENYDD